jgi:hypothetical protein
MNVAMGTVMKVGIMDGRKTICKVTLIVIATQVNAGAATVLTHVI